MINRYKFFVLISFLLLASFFITSFISYKITKEHTMQSLKEKTLPLSSDNVYSEIQKDLLKPNLVSSLMANDTFVINWILNGEKNIKNISSYLSSIKTKYNTSSSFFVSDKTKNYYYPKGILKKIKASNERDLWFYRLKNISDEYESNIDVDLANNDSLTIFTNYRVTNKEGQFLGVTGVGLKTSHVNSLLNNYKNKYKHEVYFVNTNAKIILKSKTFEKNTNKNFKKIINEKLIEFNKTDNHSLEYLFEDEKYYLNIRFIDELKLYLFIEAKEKDFTKEIKKGFLLNLVLFTILVIIIMFIIIFYINKYQKKLEFYARKDKLTELSNRHDFEDKIKKIFIANRKRDNKITLILFDIDNFKQVNDNFGHLVGDKILVLVSNIFKNIFRSTDIIARWGGEEFIAILSDINKKDSFELAEKLRISISQDKEIIALLGEKLTVSIGIAKKQKHEKEEELFVRVDKNLYIAKKQGKDQTVE